MEGFALRLNGTLVGWGRAVLIRDKFVCRYCGLDGKTDRRIWMQFSIDHVIPVSSGGNRTSERNMVACCRSCNSITSRMTFVSMTTFKAAFSAKKKRIQERHKEYQTFWKNEVKK